MNWAGSWADRVGDGCGQQDRRRRLAVRAVPPLGAQFLQLQVQVDAGPEHRILHPLRKVVVGARVQAALEGVALEVGQHEDGDVLGGGVGLELGAEGETVLARHHHVQQQEQPDGGPPGRLRLPPPRPPRRSPPPGTPSRMADQPPVDGQVVDDQDPRASGLQQHRPPGARARAA
ncbi:MAG: hypothetical protein V9E94_07465 [Microthrixaceae bacterium]